MGRGRQKAKQTKVARRLKYWSPETDYAALERELSSGSPQERGEPESYVSPEAISDEDHNRYRY